MILKKEYENTKAFILIGISTILLIVSFVLSYTINGNLDKVTFGIILFIVVHNQVVFI